VRFGIFELDLTSGELRKQGVKVKLQDQPFQVLAILTEHAGEAVTREELRQRLWPEDTFVDFEHSLATAINKIRDALGDSVQSPRYIETLPKRGYRFIAPVEPLSAAPSRLETQPAIGDTNQATGKPARRWFRGRLSWLVGGIAVAVSAAIGILFVYNVAGWRSRLMGSSGSRSDVTLPKIDSIAVIPLPNLSRDADQDYFADGMTDELITTLGKVQSLRVISRTSVQQYKKTTKTIPQIARELNVDAILEGTVLRSGGRVRITAELVNSADRQLWTDNFESDERDVLLLQDEIARAIADEISVQLQPKERARLAEAASIDPKAHEAYLEGLFFYYQESPQSSSESIRYAQRAIQLDPSYAEAYALLAASDYDSSQSRWGNLPNDVAAQRAKADALKALQLKDTLAEPHVVLGAVAEGHEWNWAVAESEFKRAIEFDPNLVTAHVGLAWHWTFMGRHDDAIQEINRAVEIDPVSDYALEHQLFIWLYNKQYDQVIEHAPRAQEMFPDDPALYSLPGDAYQAKGMYTEAVSAYQQELQREGENASVVAAIGKAFKAGGIRGVWRWQLRRRLSQFHAGKGPEPVDIASRYSLLGQKDEAIQWINREYALRGQGMLFVRISPDFNNLHSDPRYQELMKRMNFPH